MSEQEMRKCPCCSGTGDMWHRDDDGIIPEVWHYIRCRQCGLMTNFYKTEADAIAAWNQRAGEAELAALRKRILWFVRAMYGMGMINGTQAGELVGLSLPDILAKVESGEWPAQGEVAAAETRALRELREAAQAIKDSQDWYWTAKPGKDTQIEQMWTAFDDALDACDEASAWERSPLAAGEHPLDGPRKKKG